MEFLDRPKLVPPYEAKSRVVWRSSHGSLSAPFANIVVAVFVIASVVALRGVESPVALVARQTNATLFHAWPSIPREEIVLQKHHVLFVAEKMSPFSAPRLFRGIAARCTDVVVARVGVAPVVPSRRLESAPTDVAAEGLTASHVAVKGLSRERCVLICHSTAPVAPEILLVLRPAVRTVALGSSGLSLSAANRAIAWAFRFTLSYC